jgi:undecaprenyl diphosphate synthase
MEVNALMELLVSTIRSEIKTLQDNNIRLHAIGDIAGLPKATREQLRWAINETASNTHMTLTLALNYGSRNDLLRAVRDVCEDVRAGRLNPQDLTAEIFASHLSTAGMPDPELLIRTSGEMRVSNFLLWEIAYAELYVTPKLWPDFRREDLYQAIADFQKRERRFGKTGEQVKS